MRSLAASRLIRLVRSSGHLVCMQSGGGELQGRSCSTAGEHWVQSGLTRSSTNKLRSAKSTAVTAMVTSSSGDACTLKGDGLPANAQMAT